MNATLVDRTQITLPNLIELSLEAVHLKNVATLLLLLARSATPSLRALAILQPLTFSKEVFIPSLPRDLPTRLDVLYLDLAHIFRTQQPWLRSQPSFIEDCSDTRIFSPSSSTRVPLSPVTSLMRWQSKASHGATGEAIDVYDLKALATMIRTADPPVLRTLLLPLSLSSNLDLASEGPVKHAVKDLLQICQTRKVSVVWEHAPEKSCESSVPQTFWLEAKRARREEERSHSKTT
ncbi:hypothetical protein JCM11641_007394 [Rhodosporidiobolus odoratus]